MRRSSAEQRDGKAIGLKDIGGRHVIAFRDRLFLLLYQFLLFSYSQLPRTISSTHFISQLTYRDSTVFVALRGGRCDGQRAPSHAVLDLTIDVVLIETRQLQHESKR